MNEEKINIKFEGNTHQVDANTLINALVHYQNIINKTNEIYGGGTHEIRMCVNAIQKGSFVIDISLVESLRSIFSATNVAYVSGLVSSVVGVVQLYKHFKGKPIKKGDITIDKSVNITEKTINIYNTPVIREAISKSIENASEDDNVEGYTIATEQQSVTFERADFPQYIYNDFETEQPIPSERVLDQEATLVITALSFEQNGKWRFIFNGFPITATIKDEELMTIINKGERFGKGDSLKVKLRIVQKYDPTCKTYINYTYKVLSFYEHVNAPVQQNMEFDETKE